MAENIKIVGLVGSLRKDSLNKALMAAALELCPLEAKIEVADISALPLFNQDLESNLPPAVKEFKNKINNADAFLIATPEYNYSVPGGLKNALDWGSRPYGENSFGDKPVAVMSASTGMLGGARAQYHLRQIFVRLNLHPVNKPEVLVAFANDKIKEGKVVDEKTREKIQELLQALVAWTKRLAK